MSGISLWVDKEVGYIVDKWGKITSFIKIRGFVEISGFIG